MTGRQGEPARAIAAPEPGLFKMRLVRGGPFVAAELRLNDAGALVAIIDGKEIARTHPDPASDSGIVRVWTSGTRIDAAEHTYLLRFGEWAREHAPDHPAASPNKRVALAAAPPIF